MHFCWIYAQMMRSMPKNRRKRLFRRIIGLVLVLIAIFTLDYHAYPYGSYTTSPSANHGENGLWLRYTWYFGQKTPSEMTSLADRLTQNQIRYAYFHVRYIQKDGTLKYRFPQQARALTSFLHQKAPGVKLLAYAYAASAKGEGPHVDLDQLAIRKRMSEEAAWLVNECGFDGVQWDYEICSDGDPGFLKLLEDTRAALPKGALLSVATPVWYPFPLGRLGWSEDFFAQVARRCDQVAVMVYDSGFWTPRSYAWLAHQEAVHVTTAVARSKAPCRVLLGIPTYGHGFPSHNPRAERIAIAIKGVREGMADPAAHPEVFAGVAPFADYTTDESEWADFQRLWLNSGASVNARGAEPDHDSASDR
jgi:spore germination protein YaaH